MQGRVDYAGRAFYTYANPTGNGTIGFAQVGGSFNPEVGFLPRRAYRHVDGRYNLTYQPKQWPWIRRISPHANYTMYTDLENQLESSRGHWHSFDIQHRQGARFEYLIEAQQDRPRQPFTVYQDVTGTTGNIRGVSEGNIMPVSDPGAVGAGPEHARARDHRPGLPPARCAWCPRLWCRCPTRKHCTPLQGRRSPRCRSPTSRAARPSRTGPY